MLVTLLVLLKLHANGFAQITCNTTCSRCASCLSEMPPVQTIANACSRQALFRQYTLSAFCCNSTGSIFKARIQEEGRPWAATPVARHGVCIPPGAVPIGMHQQHGQHGIMSLELVPSIEAIIHICISWQQQQLLMLTPSSLLISCGALFLFCRSQR